jgi:hypothetical protein
LRNEPSGDRPGGLFYAVRAASKAALRQSWILRGPLCPDERTSLDSAFYQSLDEAAARVKRRKIN